MAQVQVLRTVKLPTERMGAEMQRKQEGAAKSMPPPQYKPPPPMVEDRSSSGEVRNYYIGKLIGKGGFARVYLVTDAQNGRVMAGKIVDKSTLVKVRHRQKLASEIKIHKSLDHHHVAKLERVFEDESRVYLLMELCNNKSMMDLIRRRKLLTSAEAAYYLLQIIDSLEYMHGKCVIHRDLKLGNIFLNSKMEVKIGDFGLAAQLLSPEERKRTICGTPNYIAPEILDKTGHSFEVDVWSLGVVFYTLLIGKPPFETNDVKTTYRKIRANSYTFPANVPISAHAKSLIQRILHTDPARRPKLAEIRAHPFFTEQSIPRYLPATALVKVPINFIDEGKKTIIKQDENQPNENNQIPNTYGNSNVRVMDTQSEAVEMPLVPTPERKSKRTRICLSPSQARIRGGLFSQAETDANQMTSESSKMKVTAPVTAVGANSRQIQSDENAVEENLAQLVPSHESKQSGEERKKSGVVETLDQEDREAFGEMHSRLVLGITQSNSPSKVVYKEAYKIKPTAPGIYVASWVDYSSKYGLGYQLSDGTIGVHFNDWSKIALSSDECFVQYFPPSKEKGGMITMSLTQYPPEMKKKILLLEMFRDYLRGPASAKRKRKAQPKIFPDTPLPIIKRWMKTQQAIIFRISTSAFQLNFYDHTKIIFNGDASVFLYIDKAKKQHCGWTNDGIVLQNSSLGRRVKFTKDVLWYLLSC